MTYLEALAYIESLHPPTIRLGLERIERLCALAGHPERKFPAVLVGGTNGKGSTAAFLAAALRAAGLRVGMAPKPHLYTPCERLQVGEEIVSEADFAVLVTQAQPLVEQVAAHPAAHCPTYFEVMTFLAFLWFARTGLDWAVVEVGLGGRFDATNILDAGLCIITDVGLDHTDRLGETIPEIAFEKAGIIKRQGRLITGATGEALEVVERVAAERSAALWRLGREIRLERVAVTVDGGRFDVRCPAGTISGLEIGMLGEHQIRNAALATAAALWLREQEPALTEEAIRRGVAAARLPGRLQFLRRLPDLVIDAAHNGDKARALARTLRNLLLPAVPERRLILILGVTRAHAVGPVVDALVPLASRVIATTNAHPQALSPEELASIVRERSVPVTTAHNTRDAVAEALATAGPQDLICVTGSFYTLAGLPPDGSC
ncbi:MAG: bifunctional folylpolyglutamate synthase/dihydrofolate synthase [Armatimonadetes bacterium]|nr:bifunctional folylpolyglutamate synthase/dihydrofolate synthase [Armatimonadota bacterium]